MMNAESVRTYDLKIGEDGRIITDDDDPGLLVHRLVRKRMAETGKDYAECFELCRRDPVCTETFRAYAQS
jgi:hypothetical protein